MGQFRFQDGLDQNSFSPVVVYKEEDDAEYSIEVDVGANSGFDDFGEALQTSGINKNGYNAALIICSAMQLKSYGMGDDVFWDSENAAAVAVTENSGLALLLARVCKRLAVDSEFRVEAIENAKNQQVEFFD